MTTFTTNISGLNVKVEVRRNPLQAPSYTHMSDEELIEDKSCNSAWWAEYKKRGLTGW